MTALAATGATFAPLALAQAQPRLAPLYGCSSLGSDAQKLSCYEREAASLKAAEASGEFAVISRQQVAEAETRAFGLNKSSATELAASAGVKTAPAAKEAAPEEMVFTVASISRGPDGRFRFVMENGQVWRQTDSGDLTRLGDGPWKAHIRKAAMGSFFLNLDERRAIRAERIG